MGDSPCTEAPSPPCDLCSAWPCSTRELSVFGAACQFSEGGRLVRGRRARASTTTPPGPILAAAAGAIRPRVCSAPRRLPRGGTRATAAAVREDFCCARCCLCLSPLPRAVLLLCARSFAACSAACASARCRVRCCCCARRVSLRAGLRVIQRAAVLLLRTRCFAAGGATCFSARCCVQCRCCVRECCLQLKSEQKGKQHPGRVSCLSVLKRLFPIAIRVSACCQRYSTTAIPGWSENF